jgi:hypothetical protein
MVGDKEQKFWSVCVRCPITDIGLECAMLYLIDFVLRGFRLGELCVWLEQEVPNRILHFN